MTSAPTLQELIELIRHDAGSDDPLDQLATASTTATELNETSDAALGYFVDRARAAGRSWVEISKVLGVTKQAVHKRFSIVSKQNLERFTDRARRTLEASVEIAKTAGHNHVGTEHLLLAQYTQAEGVAGQVLLAAGITEDQAREAIQAVLPDKSESFDGSPVFTPRAAEAMAGALAEALKLGHNYIGTEHMLLALYREESGLAAEVLNRLGLDADAARAKIVEALSGYVDNRDKR